MFLYSSSDLIAMPINPQCQRVIPGDEGVISDGHTLNPGARGGPVIFFPPKFLFFIVNIDIWVVYP